MGTARELQEKFNAIFSVERYKKALDNIKDEIKFRKTTKEKVALLEKELNGHVNQIKDWRRQREKHKEEMEEVKEKQVFCNVALLMTDT